MKPLCYIASHGAAQPHSFSFAPLTRFVGMFENLGGKAVMEGHFIEQVLLLFLLKYGRGMYWRAHKTATLNSF